MWFLGDTYGAGNGSTTFNVPQLQGKTPQGYDGNTYNLAATGGANTVTIPVTNNQGVSLTNNQSVTVTGSISNTSLTTAQLASHTHKYRTTGYNPPNPAGDFPRAWPAPAEPGYGYYDNVAAGSGTGHNHAHTLSGSLGGTVTGTLSGAVTASGTNTFSPYVVVNYIIKH